MIFHTPEICSLDEGLGVKLKKNLTHSTIQILAIAHFLFFVYSNIGVLLFSLFLHNTVKSQFFTRSPTEVEPCLWLNYIVKEFSGCVTVVV